MKESTMGKGHKMIYHWEKQGKKCYYCKNTLLLEVDEDYVSGRQIEILDCNLDHKIPQSKGGSDSLLNTCLSCISCNSMKGSMSEADFKTLIAVVQAGHIAKNKLPEYRQYLELKTKYAPIEAALAAAPVVEEAPRIVKLEVVSAPTDT